MAIWFFGGISMLIIIQEIAIEDILTGNPKDLEDFEDFISLHQKMIHYIGASKVIIDRLINDLDSKVSNRTLQTLKQIKTQSHELESIRSELSMYSILRPTLGMTIRRTENEGKSVWELGIKAAIKWLSQPLKLYGEHLIDSNIFKRAAVHYAESKPFGQRMVNAITEMTGGCGNADIVLKERFNDAISPTLLIIDSDKLSPDHVGSAAIQKCKNIITSNEGLVHFHCIEEREIENFIPLPLIKKTIESLEKTTNIDSMLVNYQRLESFFNLHPNHYKYIDLKDGTCTAWVKSKSECVKIFYNEIPQTEERCTCSKGCTGHYLVHPLCKNLLNHFFNYFNNSENNRAIKHLSNKLPNQWNKFSQLIFSMAFCNKIRVT
ncbi:hypothetical protein ABHF33_07680 [Chitinibacter sp. FCG-7]|uniref:SWIM-type domain-containing protein n=1 Tax=Chitinibacter mangrovi TaxID=3153927 RepID=A0AAU7FDT7_9NEIS